MSILASDEALFRNCLLAFYLIGPLTYISLQFLSAPYGKHSRPGWGPTIPPALAWFLMESPSVWLPISIFPSGRHAADRKALILILLQPAERLSAGAVGVPLQERLRERWAVLGERQGGGYKVPRGGWFELVSCPNYLGEVLEWAGWAVMNWSWVGFGFLLYTCANLVPRARSNHKWYLDKFGEDYPKARKAIFPYLY
ncbi:unnamed protein product [Linum tenue]|uniref:3-oxo-5-alpha-steroid 4-dehydrogenase C-terminal domain-containing protein n=1 Tax=Linum tenue TaxID=586396 RepID=A0AAV0KQE6_9ROSI|nr:unnamed protein product [Linum tenue]